MASNHDDEKLENLNRKLVAAKEKITPEAKYAPIGSGFAQGTQSAAEFASAIVVGGLMGYGVGYWLNNVGIGLSIGVFIGFAAGVSMLIKKAQNTGKNSDEETKNVASSEIED